MRNACLLVLLSLLTTITGCGQDLGWASVQRAIQREFPEVPQLAPDSLAALLDAGQTPLLLDVREPEEYAVSHLGGARQVDPDADDLAVLADVPLDTPIVAYCSVGYRSSAFAERLRAAGYTNVANLDGSIFAWANAGYPVYRDGQRVEQVHPYDRLWGRLLDANLRADLDDLDR